ncbi:MAG TPA: rhodanese-like domain-containing protein [Terracidiphilus sp.]|jgi:rhodanese-related sulfurtransferase
MTQVKLKTVSPQSLAALLGTGSGHELLDVRTPPEYSTAHVPGARLIPLNEFKTETVLARHKPGTPVFVLCQSGARAQKAISQLERDGCDDCVLVDGGTQAWIDAGLPVHRGPRTVLPLMRQVQIVVGSLSAAGAVLALAVNSWFATLPLFFGCGLLFAGISGHCGMALMLAKMPWNRGQNSCSHCCNTE